MSIVHQTLERVQEESKLARLVEGAPLPERVSAAKSPEPAALPAAADQPVITLDRAALRSAGVMPEDADKGQCAAQFRVIKHDLLRYSRIAPADNLPARFIMIGSALPGDGKSFTSMNLAMSMATEKDCDVLLIDGDVSKRHLSSALSMSKAPGLLEVLRDGARQLSSVIFPTDQPRLSFMPAGAWSEDASELLASDRMRELLQDILRRHPRTMVVIDSAPILLSPDPRVIANLVGQVVIVASAGKTLQTNVMSALDLVQGTNRRTTLVLNRMVRNKMLDAYYGYGYGYGYSSDGDGASVSTKES